MGIRKKFFQFGFFLLFMGVTGCGAYQPMEIVPDSIQSIRIKQFKNETDQIDFSEKLTEEVTDQFIREGRLTVKNSDNADSILEGTIYEYKKIPISYDENFITEEYRLTMIVNLTYYDMQREVKLWEEKREDYSGGIETSVTYYVGDTEGITETEDEAWERLIERASEKILNRTLYGWE
ncbi:MAG: LptE family protein [Elusimicrobiota bacterium]